MGTLPVNKLRALYWAEVHMREALQTCEHLLGLNLDRPELRHCIYTGIVISYARSFGENNGLSAISSQFRTFRGKRQQQLHEVLLDARKTIYAHHDLSRQGERLPSKLRKEDFQKIELEVAESGDTEWVVTRAILPETYLRDIVSLCQFQIDRIHVASDNMLAHFCRDKAYSPGRYIVGEGFP